MLLSLSSLQSDPFRKKESRPVMSNALWSHGLYSPCNSPGWNTGMGSRFLLQGIFPTQGLNPGLPRCGWILYQLSHWGSPLVEGKPYLVTPVLRILQGSCFSERRSQRPASLLWLFPGPASLSPHRPPRPRHSPASGLCPAVPAAPNVLPV